MFKWILIGTLISSTTVFALVPNERVPKSITCTVQGDGIYNKVTTELDYTGPAPIGSPGPPQEIGFRLKSKHALQGAINDNSPGISIETNYAITKEGPFRRIDFQLYTPESVYKNCPDFMAPGQGCEEPHELLARATEFSISTSDYFPLGGPESPSKKQFTIGYIEPGGQHKFPVVTLACYGNF